MYFQNSIQIERLNSHFVQELKLFRHHQGPKLGCPNSMASEQHQESFRYILEILVILLWELYKYEESEHEQVEHTWYFTSVCSLLWTVLSLRLLEKTPPNLMFKFHADNCIISVIYPVYQATSLNNPLPLKVSITSKRLQDVELQQRTRAAQKIQAGFAEDPWNMDGLVVLPNLILQW